MQMFLMYRYSYLFQAKAGEEAGEEEDEYEEYEDDEYTLSEEEVTEYTYEVIELSDSDDDDVKIINLEDEGSAALFPYTC